MTYPQFAQAGHRVTREHTGNTEYIRYVVEQCRMDVVRALVKNSEISLTATVDPYNHGEAYYETDEVCLFTRRQLKEYTEQIKNQARSGMI